MILREDYEKQLKKDSFTPPEPLPALYNPITGLKLPLQLMLLGFEAFFKKRKWLIYVILIFLFCFLGYLKVFGATIFTDNFDIYDTGTLNGQGGWACSYLTWEVINTTSQSPSNSIITQPVSYLSLCKKNGTPRVEGSVQFYVKSNNCGSGTSRNEYLEFRFTHTEAGLIPFLRVSSSDGSCIIQFEPLSDTDIIAMDSFNNWTKLRFAWYLNENHHYYFKWAYGENELGEWVESFYTDFDFPNGFNQIWLSSSYGSGGEYFYLDSIAEIPSPPPCSSYGELEECEAHSCCYYWSAFVGGYAGNYGYECGNCGFGECGVGEWLERCGNCLTQENCEAITNCYWDSDLSFCKFGTGVCNEGLELVFCKNQSDCENAGGNWYSDFCFLYPKPSYFIDFNDYYAEYGDYASPSAFVLSIASPTNDLFSGLGGFVESFNTTFDLQAAYTRGKAYGSAIPLARSYLSALDSFAGNLPIGEFFVFALVFMLAVGVFRALKGLFQLVKFW
jgi:hypothetical protein